MASRDELFLCSAELSAYVDNVLNDSDSDSGDLDGELVNVNDDNDQISDDNNEQSEASDDELDGNRPNLQTWTWNNDTNTVRQINFTGNSGINPIVSRQLNADCTELDVLNQFLTNEFWDRVVSETNQYAREKILAGGDARPNNNWIDVTQDELKAYFSLVILMSQNPKQKISDYWSRRKIIHCPIYSEVMSRDRFKSISRYLHFSSSLLETDKLRKIRPVVDLLLTSFKKVFKPGKFCCIDESLMSFRGRLAYIQFNPSKRARFGIKIYMVCDSVTGYCYNFKIYTGKETTNDTGMLVSEQVVLTMTEDLIGDGRLLFMDNWYSSPNLFLELLNRDTYCIGTLRSNRKNVPEEIKKEKLMKGEITFRSCNNMLCLKWKDRKDVTMLSTYHERPDFQEIISQRESRRENPQVSLKPNVVVDYNKYMCGVDKQDQKLSSFPVMRRSVKGYKKLFFYLFDIALYNASIVHTLITKKKNPLAEFRLNIVDQLLTTVHLPDRPSGGRPSLDQPMRLQCKQWGHFLEKIPPTSKARPSKRCKVCYDHGRRSETIYQCKKCKVPLHFENCFEIYHTVNKY